MNWHCVWLKKAMAKWRRVQYQCESMFLFCYFIIYFPHLYKDQENNIMSEKNVYTGYQILHQNFFTIILFTDPFGKIMIIVDVMALQKFVNIYSKNCKNVFFVLLILSVVRVR